MNDKKYTPSKLIDFFLWLLLTAGLTIGLSRIHDKITIPIITLIIIFYFSPELKELIPELIKKAKINVPILGVKMETSIQELIENMIKDFIERETDHRKIEPEQEKFMKILYQHGGLIEETKGEFSMIKSNTETNIKINLPNFKFDDDSETKNYKEFLRPLRNTGLIKTYPIDKPLSKCSGIKITNIGNLFVRYLLNIK